MTNEKFQEQVLAELKGLKGDLGSLKEGQAKLEGRLTNLEEGQARLEGRLTNLEEGQARLEERQTKLEDRQAKLEERQDRLEKKIDIVYDQTVKLTELYTDFNAKVDHIIEDNKSIHEILGEHEVSIRTLRRKPV